MIKTYFSEYVNNYTEQFSIWKTPDYNNRYKVLFFTTVQGFWLQSYIHFPEIKLFNVQLTTYWTLKIL